MHIYEYTHTVEQTSTVLQAASASSEHKGFAQMLGLYNASLRVKFVGPPPIHFKACVSFKCDSEGVAHICCSANICQMCEEETPAYQGAGRQNSGLASITRHPVGNSSVPRSLVRVRFMWCLLSKGP